jgi:hypothetical protein
MPEGRGFWFCWYSHHPAVEPRTRSARLLGRRALTPRTWTFQGRMPVFRALVLSYPASARLRTNSIREKREVCQWCNTVVFLPPALRWRTRTRFSWKGTMYLFFLECEKVEMTPAGAGFSSPCVNTGAFKPEKVIEENRIVCCSVAILFSFRLRGAKVPRQRTASWIANAGSEASLYLLSMWSIQS